MVCEAARLENGKLFVLGGGVGVYVCQQFPEHVRLAVVGVVDADEDIGSSGTIGVEITQEVGPAVAGVSANVRVVGVEPGTPALVPFMVNTEFDANAGGTVQIVVSMDGEIEARFPLLIRQP